MTWDTTTMAQDTKGALPVAPEVLGDIAAHSAVELAESLHTLKQCCLVNKTFRDHFQPHIYRFLDIEDDADSKRSGLDLKPPLKS
jgi:hypothetical protein